LIYGPLKTKAKAKL